MKKNQIQNPTKQAKIQNIKASNPNISAWVSANAGSGKTYVLINRIIRLLLEGNPPEKILCLTYTRAAAAEMTNRLFNRLAKWTALNDKTLLEEIKNLGSENINQKEILKNARKLFARALETPGGFKLFTLHGFCQSILRRFPIEAGLEPNFQILNERNAQELLRKARAEILHEAALNKNTKEGKSLKIVIEYSGNEQFDSLLNEFLKYRKIAQLPKIQPEKKKWCQKLGIPDDFNSQTFPKYVLKNINQNELNISINAIKKYGTPEEINRTPAALNAGNITQNIQEHEWADILKKYMQAFLTQNGTPRKNIITKNIENNAPQTLLWMQQEQNRILNAYHTYLNGKIYEATHALLILANKIIKQYDKHKKWQSIYDYDDLIRYTYQLLQNQNIQWVLYKLDGGIDHILIDEAQDTSPEQWNIIKILSEEFFAGEGPENEKIRTVFVVGDYKQSIFSFQGADPDAFREMREYFSKAAKNAQQQFNDVPFLVSWRAAQPILKMVDIVFNHQNAKNGVLENKNQPLKHIPTRKGHAGKIEIWETEKPDENNKKIQPWDAPVDQPKPEDPKLKLAQRITNKIKNMIGKEYLQSCNRTVCAGDILILVQRRNQFVTALIRELKKQNIPVAGADRLKLSKHVAIQDLITLAKTMCTPEDDLSLATLIKSPIIQKENGDFFDEEDLFEIAHNRENTLWNELQKKSEPKWKNLNQTLQKWKQKSQKQTPFQFFAEILGKEKKHLSFAKRMGSEVTDPIDEFTELLWQYHTTQPAPNLHGFIYWFEAGETEIKRDMEHGKNEVRIMTVHAAKGLEANIVFLPDSCATPDKKQDNPILLIPGENPVPIWRLNTKYETPIIKTVRDHYYQKRIQEYHRLLYVAITRARDQFYLCGWEGKRQRSDMSWYDLIRTPLTPHMQKHMQKHADEKKQKTIWIMENKQETDPEKEEDIKQAYIPIKPPKWAYENAKRENVNHILNPSQLILENEKYNQNTISPIAKKNGFNERRRGNIIHKILQYIPEIEREKQEITIAALIKKYAPQIKKNHTEQIKKHILNIVQHHQFGLFFNKNGLSEAHIAGKLPIKQNNQYLYINGYIDRIHIEKKHIYVLDFKTSQNPPSSLEKIPPIHIRQMALYKLALKQQYIKQAENKKIRIAILWTNTPQIMEIPEKLMQKTLQKYMDAHNIIWAS